MEDKIIHSAAGLHERGSDDRQRAAVLCNDLAILVPNRIPFFVSYDHFALTRARKDLFRNVHRLDIDAARHRSAGIPHPLVKRAGKSGNRVKEQKDVFSGLDESLAAFRYEIGKSNVAFEFAVQTARDDFRVNRQFEVGNFFGSLVNKKNNDVDVGIIQRNRLTDLFQ